VVVVVVCVMVLVQLQPALLELVAKAVMVVRQHHWAQVQVEQAAAVAVQVLTVLRHLD
jgi:hypothetical protein